MRATHSAIAKWGDHFLKLGQPIMEEAMQTYIEQMRLIAKECNCRRQ